MNKLIVYTERFNLANATHNYQEAFRISQKQMKLAQEAGDMSNVEVAMQDMVLALEGIGRYKEAYHELLKMNQLTDSLNAEDNREKLNELNKRFEVNELKMQAEREKMELERDKIQAERRQLYLIIAIILLALIGGALFAFYRYRAAKRIAKMRAAQERIEGELQIARDIQMSMVPSTFPDYEGLDMYASMTPAKEVGGDLYGYVVNGSQLYFAVGDVSGKGVPASLFMAQATRLFRTMAHQGMEPAAICTRMNQELSGDDNANGMFVTMFIGMLHLGTGHLSFCNAGHNPPVLVGGENKGDFLDMVPNAPIGLWPELDYEGEEIETIKGRALFIYTDGLNEAENTAQQQFGDERLLKILRNTHFDTAQQVIKTMETEVEKHRNGAEPNDDLTMMGIYLRS
jgi:serine phosphatase RsbU (regulator of sigma subunit)